LLRLNQGGALDSTFQANVGYISGTPVVEAIAPAGDGTQDIYFAGRIGTTGSSRVKDTGAFDPTYAPVDPLFASEIAPAHDGTTDVFLSQGSNRGGRLLRLDRTGAAVPTFREPVIDAEILQIIPVPDGTRDLYLGGAFMTYNGIVVNHIARVHADGSLASVVSTPQ
jgi:hypothetical protein